MKEDYWICIIKSKDIPNGFDTSLRIALREEFNSKDVEIDYIFSGWGLLAEVAEKITNSLCKVQTREKLVLLHKLFQNKIAGVIGEEEDMPLTLE